MISSKKKKTYVNDMIITIICLMLNSIMIEPKSYPIIKITYHLILQKINLDIVNELINMLFYEIELNDNKISSRKIRRNNFMKKTMLILIKFVSIVNFFVSIYFIIDNFINTFNPLYLTINYSIMIFIQILMIIFVRCEFNSIYKQENRDLLFLCYSVILFWISQIMEIALLNYDSKFKNIPMITIINFVRTFGLNYFICLILFLHSTFEEYYIESISFDILGCKCGYMNYVFYLFPILFFKKYDYNHTSLNYDFME
jgi:hypothetical protein